MGINPVAKEFLLKNVKLAIGELQEKRFEGMKKLVMRMNVVSEMFPDEVWTKELNLVCLSMAVIGASTEADLPKMAKDKAEEIIKKYSEKLNGLYVAIEEESIAKIDTFLKEFAELYFKEIGL
jgi:hypothetical protein